MSLFDWLHIAADLKLDATELTHSLLASYEASYLKQIRRALDASGLEVDQLCNIGDFLNPDPQVRAHEVDLLRRQVDAAALLGAGSIRVTAGQEHPELSVPAAIGRFKTCLQPCWELAEQAGVKLLFENHYKYILWDRPDYSFRSENFLAFASALRDTPVEINFDCANQIMAGEDPLPVLEQIKDRVRHVHANDRATPGQYKHSVVGEGVTPLREIFRILIEAGFNGYVSLEYNGTEGLDGMTRSLEAVRRIWAEAADSLAPAIAGQNP